MVGSEALLRLLEPRIHGVDLAAWLERAAAEEGEGDLERLDRLFPGGERKRVGLFFTPIRLADLMAGEAGEPSTAFDPAAGSGDLLWSVHERAPGCRLFAVEQDPDLAVACCVRGLERDADIEVWVADGLSVDPGPRAVDLVVMNPPYLGEKGNAEMFRRLCVEHPHLEPAFTARTDLANLFLFQGLERVAPGGRLVALTSEYWLQSDAADPIRRRIASHFRLVSVERFGVGQFPDAPGHHSLVTVVERAPRTDFEARQGDSVHQQSGSTLENPRWNPFAPTSEREGVPLGELVKTCQGFVSGADRVTRRHLKLAPGCGGRDEPIFLFDARPTGRLGELVEPVLRGRQLVAGEVIESFEPICWVLWVDRELDPPDPALLAHLEPFRPILERRREARTGRMPWYRLHWPRDREAMRRPKLVTPRRAPSPTFALDLTGAPVSSDCTWLVAPEGVDDEIAWLLRLMEQLNSASAEAWLRRHGKSKGELLEFYAGPLEALPVTPP